MSKLLHVDVRATPRVRVLVVCMGNICRSPTAQGMLEKLARDSGLADRVQVDSAGTHGGHIGAPPDERAQEHARRRGLDLSAQRARALCSPEHAHKLRRLTDFCTHHAAREVPDPYYGGGAGFEAVLDLVEDACTGLLRSLIAARQGR